jgi:hypothetical protein
MSKPYKKTKETVQPLQVVKASAQAQPAILKVMSKQEEFIKMPPPEVGCFKGRDNDCL